MTDDLEPTESLSFLEPERPTTRGAWKAPTPSTVSERNRVREKNQHAATTIVAGLVFGLCYYILGGVLNTDPANMLQQWIRNTLRQPPHQTLIEDEQIGCDQFSRRDQSESADDDGAAPLR